MVFIAAEEGGEKKIGVDMIMEKGKLEEVISFVLDRVLRHRNPGFQSISIDFRAFESCFGSKLKLASSPEAKNGPVFWVDSADSNPCCGTAGAISWPGAKLVGALRARQLKCKGRLFHSGFPNKGINSIELAQECMAFIQEQL